MPDRPIPAGDLITLQEAAQYAGYRRPSTLRQAARDGTLRVVRKSPRVILTTHDWVEEYLLSVAGKGGLSWLRTPSAIAMTGHDE